MRTPTMHPHLQPRAATRPPARAQHGFTLVEVLVALFIMAVMAGMAWQGIDGLVRTRDGAQQASESTLRLGTVMAQWDADLEHLQQTPATPTLKFDGSSLRLTRRHRDGLQLVLWTMQQGKLHRWASPAVTRVQELQDWWFRSQQWSVIQADALPMLDGVAALQIYFYQQGDNTWSNAQSTGNVSTGKSGNRTAKPPPGGGTPPGGAPGNSPPADAGTAGANGNGGVPTLPDTDSGDDTLPIGIRLVLTLPQGRLLRDVALQPAQ